MNPTEKHRGAQHILFDADELPDIESAVFEPKVLAQRGLLRGSAEGRGTTHFVEINGRDCVLRHYRRGGRVARLLGDRYWRGSLLTSRAWREWHLLADLSERGLSVPRPLAARVIMRGPFYSADLLTLRIPEAQPLSQWLIGATLAEADWRAIGACIRRFHDLGVWHADLNAHNILLDTQVGVWLIDFDRGELRTPARDWQQANLVRLRRSLDKLSGVHEIFHFHDCDWQALISA
jgi:3-deoxy-D-manno-octulosonic acid kinase